MPYIKYFNYLFFNYDNNHFRFEFKLDKIHKLKINYSRISITHNTNYSKIENCKTCCKYKQYNQKPEHSTILYLNRYLEYLRNNEPKMFNQLLDKLREDYLKVL